MLRVKDSETPVLDGDTYYYFMASLADLDPFGDRNSLGSKEINLEWVRDSGEPLPEPEKYDPFDPNAVRPQRYITTSHTRSLATIGFAVPMKRIAFMAGIQPYEINDYLRIFEDNFELKGLSMAAYIRWGIGQEYHTYTV